MRGKRLWVLAGPAAALLLMACQQPSATPTAEPAAKAGAVGAPVGTAPAAPANWKRPVDVTPAAEQGKFKVIAQEPAPGDRVRVFFLGAQF
jgi:hypothetical protein